MSFVFSFVSKKSTKELKNQENWFQRKNIIIEKGMIKCFVWELYNNPYSIQSFLFKWTYNPNNHLPIVFGLIWNESSCLVQKILECLINFAIFVAQPLFYLNGDVNFRNRVHYLGHLKSSEKRTFSNELKNPTIVIISK